MFGYKEYEITGFGYQKLYRLLMEEHIPAKDMQEKNDRLYLRLSEEYCKKFEKLCENNKYEFCQINEKGLVRTAKILRRRLGLIIGFVVVLGLTVYFSNVAVDIRVLSDDKELTKEIKQVLKEEGVQAGSYIPNINYVVAERALRQKVDKVSWAGISRKGSVLFVDIMENKDIPETTQKRLPSNLTACEDAVIDKLEILDGQVVLGVGCGVTKGDVIVSGKIITSKSDWKDGEENVDTKIDYTRCIGKVYGTFERTVTFTQGFDDREQTLTGKEKDISYLNLFSADIPLFTELPAGYYKTETKTSALKLFGIETPIKITQCKLKEYDFKIKKLNEEQAKKILETKTYKYEQNFLKDYEIKDRNSEIISDENGVTQKVTYTLYGVISKETEFFINK